MVNVHKKIQLNSMGKVRNACVRARARACARVRMSLCKPSTRSEKSVRCICVGACTHVSDKCMPTRNGKCVETSSRPELTRLGKEVAGIS